MSGIYGNNFVNQSILNEDTIYRGNGILITVDSSGSTERNFDKDPYFKVYNNESVTKATAIARIHVDNALYEKQYKGLPEWELNSKDRKKLDSIMNEKPNGNNMVKNFDTVYDAIIAVTKEKTNGKYKPKYNSCNRPNYKDIER